MAPSSLVGWNATINIFVVLTSITSLIVTFINVSPPRWGPGEVRRVRRSLDKLQPDDVEMLYLSGIFSSIINATKVNANNPSLLVLLPALEKFENVMIDESRKLRTALNIHERRIQYLEDFISRQNDRDVQNTQEIHPNDVNIKQPRRGDVLIHKKAHIKVTSSRARNEVLKRGKKRKFKGKLIKETKKIAIVDVEIVKNDTKNAKTMETNLMLVESHVAEKAPRSNDTLVNKNKNVVVNVIEGFPVSEKEVSEKESLQNVIVISMPDKAHNKSAMNEINDQESREKKYENNTMDYFNITMGNDNGTLEVDKDVLIDDKIAMENINITLYNNSVTMEFININMNMNNISMESTNVTMDNNNVTLENINITMDNGNITIENVNETMNSDNITMESIYIMLDGGNDTVYKTNKTIYNTSDTVNSTFLNDIDTAYRNNLTVQLDTAFVNNDNSTGYRGNITDNRYALNDTTPPTTAAMVTTGAVTMTVTPTSPPSTTPRMETLEQTVNELKAKLAKLEKPRSRVRSASRKKIKGLEKKLSEMRKQYRKLKTRMNSQSTKIASFDALQGLAYRSEPRDVRDEYEFKKSMFLKFEKLDRKLSNYKDLFLRNKYQIRELKSLTSKQDHFITELQTGSDRFEHKTREMTISMLGVERNVRNIYNSMNGYVSDIRWELRVMLDRVCGDNKLHC